jgi:8-oxo-dGTP pyrophosphatase MutT (NUDIX family)
MRQWHFTQIAEFRPVVGFETKFCVTCGGREFLHVWKVTEVVPPTRIAYDWRYAGYQGDAHVVFELSASGAATEIRLTHQTREDFPHDLPEFSRANCQSGWTYFIRERLRQFIAGRADRSVDRRQLEGSWHHLGSQLLRDYGSLRLREDRYRFTPTGAEADFAVCESADWVLVIPVTEDRQVVFVRQFRHGLGDVVLEIPGGLMDRDERPEETAVRELREETGYVAGPTQAFGPLLPNPALNTARFHVVVATRCTPSSVTNPDPLEQIATELRPLSSVAEMIRSGELQHAQCIAAFALSEAYLARPD